MIVIIVIVTIALTWSHRPDTTQWQSVKGIPGITIHHDALYRLADDDGDSVTRLLRERLTQSIASCNDDARKRQGYAEGLQQSLEHLGLLPRKAAIRPRHSEADSCVVDHAEGYRIAQVAGSGTRQGAEDPGRCSPSVPKP
ncbi:hypothetical protein N9971_00570 [bacterium]|nr:hypothetical protein [bacterium]